MNEAFTWPSATICRASSNIFSERPYEPSLNCSIAAWTISRKRRPASPGSSASAIIRRIALTWPPSGSARDVGDRGQRPARHAAAERPEHLVGAADDAEPADAVEVLLQLGPVLRLQRGLEHGVRHERGCGRPRPAAACGRGSGHGAGPAAGRPARAAAAAAAAGRGPARSPRAPAARRRPPAARSPPPRARPARGRPTGGGRSRPWRRAPGATRRAVRARAPAARDRLPGRPASRSGPSARRYASSSAAPISSKSPIMWILRAEWNSSSPSARAPPWTSTCRTHQFTICWAAKAGGSRIRKLRASNAISGATLSDRYSPNTCSASWSSAGSGLRGVVAHRLASGRCGHTIITGPMRGTTRRRTA